MATKREMRVALLEQALTRKGQLHLKEAARLLQVSEMTVRRDIGANKHAFVYLGGHIFLPPTVSGYKLSTEDRGLTEAKAKAARHAAGLIKSNTTIFIDSGTTLLHLATSIPRELELTVVTSSLNVATRIADRTNIRLVLLGGLYHPASDCFIASDGEASHRTLGINQAFLSAGGFDPQRGASCYQFHEAALKRAILAQATHSYLIIDSSKIGVLRPVLFAPPRAFDRVLTEEGALRR